MTQHTAPWLSNDMLVMTQLALTQLFMTQHFFTQLSMSHLVMIQATITWLT